MSNSISGSSTRNSQYYSPPLEDKEPGRDLNSKTKALGSEQAHEGDEIELSEQATSETQSHSDGVANESTIVRTLICEPDHEVEQVVGVSTEAPRMKVEAGVNADGSVREVHSGTGFQVRESVAPHLRAVRDEAARQGVNLYSSGGFRALNAPVGPGRSAQSLHYTGRAVDLFTFAGMRNPQTDPYVVVLDGDKWRVYARTTEPHGETMSLNAVRFAERGPLPTEQATGRFVDLTAIFERHGFSRIGPRSDFHMNSNGTHDRGSAEWWHFEYRGGMQRGSTRFGDELQEINRCGPALENSPPWQYRDYRWNGNGQFSR